MVRRSSDDGTGTLGYFPVKIDKWWEKSTWLRLCIMDAGFCTSRLSSSHLPCHSISDVCRKAGFPGVYLRSATEKSDVSPMLLPDSLRADAR